MSEFSMVHEKYVVTGTLQGDRTVILDESIPLAPMRVRLTVEALRAVKKRKSLDEFMAWLRARQEARGHVPMSDAEIDAYIQAERDSWDE
ncbi:MAG: hypothetical protein HUU16_11400 [Candidatus Omnitrophica bacterium]|nr:hypothetical protein [Candidatus Omnitrophota bacterium]